MKKKTLKLILGIVIFLLTYGWAYNLIAAILVTVIYALIFDIVVKNYLPK